MSELDEEPLQTTPALMATGFTMMFSDSLNNRFNNLLVAAAGATVNQMGFLQGAKSLSGNLLQLVFGRLVDRYGKKRFIAAGRLLNAGAIAALLVFDADAREQIELQCKRVIVAGRLWYTGTGVAALLAALAVVFGCLRIDQTTGGSRRGMLVTAAAIVLSVLVAVGVLLAFVS